MKVGEGADVIVTTPHELRILSNHINGCHAAKWRVDQDYNERDLVDASIHLTGQLTALADNSLLRLGGT